MSFIRTIFFSLALAVAARTAEPPPPTYADVSYGAHPNQRLDVYLPAKGAAPYPVVVWYGGIWKPAKKPANLPYFGARGVAVVAVETRTLTQAMEAKEPAPISWVMQDALRAVQTVRARAAEWQLDAKRVVVGGSSQGSLPALYVACSPDHADADSADTVARQSTKVLGVLAHRSQPSIDPQRMQAWVPGVQWGAPALGVSFERSLAERERLLPIIQQWSPEHQLSAGSAPVYFEYNWGLTQPEGVSKMDYLVHSPAWALGFQKMAQAAGAKCEVQYPGHAVAGFENGWDFLAKQLGAKAP